MMYPIGHLLAGAGASSSSDVWGVAGEKVTALLAIHDTELDLVIPKLKAGAEIRVTQWDRQHRKIYEQDITYDGGYRRPMRQFDLIVIEALEES